MQQRNGATKMAKVTAWGVRNAQGKYTLYASLAAVCAAYNVAPGTHYQVSMVLALQGCVLCCKQQWLVPQGVVVAA